MARRAGSPTQLGLSQQPRVIGDDREVEGTPQPNAAQGLPRLVIGLKPDGFAAGEAIGVAGCVACALPPGVEGEGRVHVGVAEVRLAQRITLRAGLALFGAREGERAVRRQQQRDEREQRDSLAAPNGSTHR